MMSYSIVTTSNWLKILTFEFGNLAIVYALAFFSDVANWADLEI